MNTLLAVDGSDHAYEAVRALKYLRRADQLTLLHVVDAPRPAYPMMVPEVAQELYAQLERSMKEDGEELLTRIQSLLPLHSGPVTKLLQMGSPAEHIVAAAQSCRSHRYGGERPGPGEGTAARQRLSSRIEYGPLRQIRSPRIIAPVEAHPPPVAGTVRRRGGTPVSRQTALSGTGECERPDRPSAHTSPMANRRYRG